MQICPHCGQRVLYGLDRCPYCQAAMNASTPRTSGYCTTCGAPTPLDARFCNGCGRKLLVEDVSPHPIPFAKGRDVQCPYCDALLREAGLEICPFCARRLRAPSTRRPGFRRRRGSPREREMPVRGQFCMHCGEKLPHVDSSAPDRPRFCPRCGRELDGIPPAGSEGDGRLPRTMPASRHSMTAAGQCQSCGRPLPYPLDRWPTGEPRICSGCGYHLGGASRDGRHLTSGSGHVQRKDQSLAAVLSLFVPGLGQVYNGRLGRGCVVLGGTLLGLVLMVLPGLCVWGFGVWDGYRMAREMNLGNLPYAPTPTMKMAAFAVLPLLFVLLLIPAMVGPTSTPLPPPPLPPSTPVDYTHALSVPYDDLFRYNEQYVAKTVRFSGKIDQVSKGLLSQDEYVFRVATKENEYLRYSGDVIWVNYKGPRYLEGDVIEVCGAVRGLKEYTAILGNSVMIPEVDAGKVTLVSKSGSS